MTKPIVLLALVGLAAGGWYAATRYSLQGLENVKLQPREAAANDARPAGPDPNLAPPGKPLKPTIRIGSANFGPLDAVKLARPNVATRLVQVIRQFDLLAMQDLRARDQSLLVQLLEQVNAQGRKYHYAVAPAVGRDPVQQYDALVFDTETVQIDRLTVASVDNRRGQFRHPPLVAAFQARGPATSEAFTFTVVCVHTPLDRVEAEMGLLASVYRAVRDDGRNEDDVLMLGVFGTDDEHLGPLGQVANLTAAVSGVPTTARGARLLDNILFDRRATIEYTRRSGVMDLQREFNVPLKELLDLTEHLPVWADFSVYEGGQRRVE